MARSTLWKHRMEHNLPYGWQHTHEFKATSKYGEQFNINKLCRYLGRHRKGTQAWERDVKSGINYEHGLGAGIVRQNQRLPSGRWLFPRWVTEVGFPAPPPPPPPQVWTPPYDSWEEREELHGGEVRYVAVPPNALRTWRPPFLPQPVCQYAGQNAFAANLLPASASVAAAPQEWDSPAASSFPASLEGPSLPPAAAAPSPSDWAMNSTHPPAGNPWPAAANPLPFPLPAFNEATWMPPALPEQNWHPGIPFPASHDDPYFRRCAPASVPAASLLSAYTGEYLDDQMVLRRVSLPASLPADVSVDVPMSNGDFLAGFEPAVLTDPGLDAFGFTEMTDAEVSSFASAFADF